MAAFAFAVCPCCCSRIPVLRVALTDPPMHADHAQESPHDRHAPRATGTVKACALAPLDFCGLESHGRSFPRSSGIGGRPRRAATPTRSGGHLRVWTRSGESDSGAVCHRPCHAVEAGDHGLGPRSSGSLRGVANGSTCALLRAFSIGSPDSRPMLDCPRRLHTNTAASTAMAVRIGPPDEWPSFAAVRTY